MIPISCCTLNSSGAGRYLDFSAESSRVPVPLYNCIERSQHYTYMMGHCDPFVSQMPENPTLKSRYLPAPEELSEKHKNKQRNIVFSRRSATF